MHDKIENYVEFLMKQIVLFQDKTRNNLNVKDIRAISKLVEKKVYDEIENTKEFHLPLAYIIGSETMSTKLDDKDIRKEMQTENKKKLRVLKAKLSYQKMIKDSKFLMEIRKKKNILDDTLLENIPAIDCFISNNSFKAIGYTEDGYKSIYEINKNDEKASSIDISLISMKEVITKEPTQTTK